MKTNTGKVKAWVFPGQGSQELGMGVTVFEEFPELVDEANEILGYSIKQLCLEGPAKQLNQTEYTQPALYTVNALQFYKKRQDDAMPDFVAGHSLGEYVALLAAGAVDFRTGLRLVQKRGQLMSEAREGGMAAVLNLPLAQLENVLHEHGLDDVDIANYNTPSQIVISGQQNDIRRASEILNRLDSVRCVPLRVSGAFHSRQMRAAQKEFSQYLRQVDFADPVVPVISNVTARPHEQTEIAANLARQMTQTVNWVDSIRYLLGQSTTEFEEVGPGKVLSHLVAKIRAEAAPLVLAEDHASQRPTILPARSANGENSEPLFSAVSLGCQEFRREHNTRYAYVIGSMERGIASKELVIQAGTSGLLSYFGTAGLELDEVGSSILAIQRELGRAQAYGMNLLHHPGEPEMEEKLIELFLEQGIQRIEVASFLNITPALVKYRLRGLKRDDANNTIAVHKILAKVFRLDAAQAFMSPAPPGIVNDLLNDGQISLQEAELAKTMPMADDVCVEANSAWYVGSNSIFALLPTVRRQRDVIMGSCRLNKRVRVGAAGGIGSPEAAAAAFMLGADFILTGSINQCTVEAGVSDQVKDILQTLDIQNTTSAPTGCLFELGCMAQVVSKDMLFAARAKRLYDLYKHHDSLESIDSEAQKEIQERYFGCSFGKVYGEIQEFYTGHRPRALAIAERSPKYKMGLIFKWYFDRATQWAIQGRADQKVNYLIYCSMALGAFNQWVKGTELEKWRYRHVDEVGIKLMEGAASFLTQQVGNLGLADSSVLPCVLRRP